MRIINSIKGRLSGLKNTIDSHYWEYAAYDSDGILWDKTVLFESFGGTNFQGNPYYIYKEILKDGRFFDFELVISHRQPEKLLKWLRDRALYDSRVRVVQTASAQYRDTLAHAKYLVNNVSFNMDYIKKPGQVYLNTWHGTPLKCLGRNIKNDPFECNNAQRNFLLCDYLLAPNALTQKVYEEDYMVRGILPGQLLLTGYPRNSVFFDEVARQAVREKYALDGVKNVLFMPTWRGTACGVDDVDQVSQIEQLAKDLGDGYRVYVKLHPAVQKPGAVFRCCHNMPQDVEVYEFLNAMDILITDYSSVFFDFASTGKAVVLYQYDREQYYASRGVYDEVAENLPFPVAFQYDELLAAVRSAKPVRYLDFLQHFCPCDGKDAAVKAMDLLLQEPEKRTTQPVDLYVIDFPVTQSQLLKWRGELVGKNYRFAFVLKRRTGHFRNIQCWNKLDYVVLYMYDRLTPGEKLKYLLCSGIYACFRSKKALEVIQALGRREQRRLWGDLNVGNIYARSNRLPAAVGPFVKNWPEELS